MMNTKQLTAQWLAWDRNPQTRGAIEALEEQKRYGELRRLLSTRIKFGTAGLRARMGPGNNEMNDLTVIQTAQGLAAYLHEQFQAEDLKTRGFVIGFDGRHYSQRFAQLSAAVMKDAGIRTYLFDRFVPTPFVPFTILHFKCVAGVMVTASHNPKQDNGYKVYWANGAQIIPPHDAKISRAITQNLEPRASSWTPYKGDVNPYEEIAEAYFARFAALYKPASNGSSVRFTYTAMHGVGAPFTFRALAQVGVPQQNVVSVGEQERPDADFPTLLMPNPEEGFSSLRLAVRTAKESECAVILANDPDADRLGVAELQDNGQWRFFTGDEVGTLLGWWAVFHAKRQGLQLDQCYFLSSIVSSQILQTIAQKEGIHFQETLTGFKWLGTAAANLEKDGDKTVLLAYEESIGYMWRTCIYDKDGVTAAAVVADLACYLRSEEKKSLARKLLEVYETYGYHFSIGSYVTATSAEAKEAMFTNIRTMKHSSFPKRVAGARVIGVRDLSTGLDTRKPDKRSPLPTMPSSPVITFFFDNQVRMTIRSSGTEPKLKWAAQLVTSDSQGAQAFALFVARAVNELIEPERYGFKRRPQDEALAAKAKL